MLKYSDLFLFKGLPQKETEKITSNLSDLRKFKKGEIIYSKTDFPNAIGFIINGTAVAVSNNRNETFLNKFEKNMCFGVAAVFGGGDNYISTITAKTDVTVLFITEEQLKSIFSAHPQTAINYINFLSEKVRFLNNKLCVISCTNACDTLFNYLKSIADEKGCAKIPQSMTLLSKMLGVSRASLYRALDTLLEKGNIVKENNNIKVIKNEKTN